MKDNLSLGDKCILARNQNEIQDIVEARNRYIKDSNEAIEELRKQSREILGRE